MIRIMRLWKNGDVTNIGVFTNYFWAWCSITSSYGKRMWIEEEKKPATLVGHS